MAVGVCCRRTAVGCAVCVLLPGLGQPGLSCFASVHRAAALDKAMALRITRNMKLNAENQVKASMAGAKRVPVATAAACKPRMRPHRALGDTGNKVSKQPQARGPLKKA